MVHTPPFGALLTEEADTLLTLFSLLEFVRSHTVAVSQHPCECRFPDSRLVIIDARPGALVGLQSTPTRAVCDRSA